MKRLMNRRLIDWPSSQVCMDCPLGQFVDIEGKVTSYLCHWEPSETMDHIPNTCPADIPIIFKSYSKIFPQKTSLELK